MPPITYALLGYALGSIPFGLLLTRLAGLGDIRKIGSGNIGATNVLRTGNKKVAAATLLLDVLKGTAPAMVATYLAGPEAGLWAGLGAVLGHMFPVWLGFKGGKAVATAVGVLIAIAWPVALGAALVWLAVAVLARISSLAALAACAAAPVMAWFLADIGVVYLSFTIAVLIYVRHHANIRRLLDGTEPRIGRKSAEPEASSADLA